MRRLHKAAQVGLIAAKDLHLAVSFALLTATVAHGQAPTAMSGMVSTGHPIATEAGLAILRNGGNAFDAAVAIASTLNVVEPMMSGIGGYGTILIYDARTKRVRFLNASSRIPRAVNADVYRAPTPDYLKNRVSAKAVSTPGNVHAWEAMSREYGSKPWRALFAPAIAAADNGFVISPRIAQLIASAYKDFPAHARAIYGHDDHPLAAGERLTQKDLARTMRTIASRGAGTVYGGEIGKTIDRAMRESGGFLALADLRADTAEWWEPISIQYRGNTIYTSAPPANSFDALARLGVMERFDNKALGHNSIEYLHRFAEVTKLGFWLRLKYAGDPELSPPPIAALLSKDSLDAWASRVDLAHASPFVPPGAVGSSGMNTTHFVVADKWGNIVSATQTLGNVFGSRIMPEGTGVWLNNSLAYSTFEPKGNAMDAFPGRRKLSGDVPTIVISDGRPWLAIGTPGGHTIGQTVPQMVLNAIDFGMDVQSAISAPRVSFAEPNVLLVESGVPESVRAGLQSLGHTVRVVTALGDAHGLTIEYDARGRPIVFRGGSDPRGEGVAKGY